MKAGLGLVGGLAALAPCAVAAQTAPGHAPAQGTTVSRLEAAQELGGCVARHEPKVAATFVLSAAGSGVGDAARAKLLVALRNCMGRGSATLRGEDIKGVMAEALLKQQRLLEKVRDASPMPAQRLTGLGEDARQRLFDCAIDAQPADAAKMLDQKPESPEEAAQFRALIPSLQACMPKEGNLSFKPFEVRLLVAIAAYRNANPATGA